MFTSRIRSRCNIHRLTQPFANICFYDTRTFSPRAFINRGEGWNFWECFIIRDPGLAYKNRPPLSLSLSLSLSLFLCRLHATCTRCDSITLVGSVHRKSSRCANERPRSRFPVSNPLTKIRNVSLINGTQLLLKSYFFPSCFICIYSFIPDNNFDRLKFIFQRRNF